MSWVDHMEGTLPADDLRRAFVAGAQWWNFVAFSATMFSSERNQAEAAAEARYPGGKPPDPNYEPPAVTYEAALEVRAGTPLGLPDPLNLRE